MTDLDPTQTPEGTPAPAAPAPAPAVDVEAIKAELAAQFNTQMEDRIKGFQRMLNERDEQLRQLQAASLSEEEQEQLAIQEQEQRAQALEAENWLLRKAQENAEAAKLFKEVIEIEDPEEQFGYFAALAQRLSAPAPEAPEPEVQVPDSDPNNPATFYGTPGAEVLTLGGKTYTPSQIDEMLKGMTSWPSQ